MNYTDTYITETHVIEEALKERHLTGQSVRAVTIMVFFLVSAVGATPNNYNRCRSFRPHSSNIVKYNSPIGLPC